MKYYTYTKFAGDRTYKATDINDGRQVSNLLRATLLDDKQETREKLQRLADLNADLGLKIQLRRNGHVYFETK